LLYIFVYNALKQSPFYQAFCSVGFQNYRYSNINFAISTRLRSSQRVKAQFLAMRKREVIKILCSSTSQRKKVQPETIRRIAQL